MNDSESLQASMTRVERAVEALRSGCGILLTDNEQRENEGDLIFPAEKISLRQMALLIRACSGIVCLCITPQKAAALGLPPMVRENTSRYGTNFTVSVEAARGTTTGVSAADRLRSVQTASADGARPEDLVRPGHLFPLVAHPDGVCGRQGHTEGSVELMKIAGLKPCAVLCELMNPDGTMARRPEIEAFGRQHGYPVVSVDDILRYRQAKNGL
ncbi:MAG TPA: 3,4-dihydroxy-2-butanone-4-phosphate synthase [Candidatus Alistipes intestinigallinarum]|uniref:3,4-dihydroxy-2-butanone 4-phosphate synthase n=1 Tax=Candidatus Alistipes intestinigallinarum TaxID=2838440 RepID=A0A9D1YZ52_9BACT|nr:3,4-dihydroxy-2-butanone-4-phosphate synthase [Candidatus Alistipes intestinigallinarum]